ncbi:MAG: hypothetical protein WAQ98_03520 [Blastocatellia bacterium]
MSMKKTEISLEESIVLKEEIKVLKAEIALLEKENAESFFPLRILRKWLVIGPVKKLEWAFFKLKFKEKDLLLKITDK